MNTADGRSVATPNSNVNAWYLIGMLQAEVVSEGSISVEAWNAIMWDASNATRFQR